jgi:glycosyltransferase involved in cell wall biosynthesis
MKLDLTLVLPCYNERDVFAGSVARIVDVLESSKLSYELIFVDDKSRDNTVSLIKKACGRYKRTRAIFHAANAGRGAAVMDGIKVARGAVVGFIDIDCEVGPEYIPQMVRTIIKKRADVVIGKRVYRSSVGSLVREVLSRGYQWISDVMIGTQGLDTETGYKFFRRSKIVPILGAIEHTGWFWDTEIMVRCLRAGLVVTQEPVLFVRRFDKQSSVRILQDTWQYLVHLIQFRFTLAHE